MSIHRVLNPTPSEMTVEPGQGIQRLETLKMQIIKRMACSPAPALPQRGPPLVSVY